MADDVYEMQSISVDFTEDEIIGNRALLMVGINNLLEAGCTPEQRELASLISLLEKFNLLSCAFDDDGGSDYERQNFH